jgi:hypothetical protein
MAFRPDVPAVNIILFLCPLVNIIIFRKLKSFGAFLRENDVEIALFIFLTPLLILLPLPLNMILLGFLVLIVHGIAQNEHFSTFEPDNGSPFWPSPH